MYCSQACSVAGSRLAALANAENNVAMKIPRTIQTLIHAVGGLLQKKEKADSVAWNWRAQNRRANSPHPHRLNVIDLTVMDSLNGKWLAVTPKIR